MVHSGEARSGNGWPEDDCCSGTTQTDLKDDLTTESDISSHSSLRSIPASLRKVELLPSYSESNNIIESCVSAQTQLAGAAKDEVSGTKLSSATAAPSQSDCDSHEKKSNFLVQYFKRKCQGWSREQVMIILILSFVEFFASAVVSIQAPFYPDVASSKGASATEYGLVFGIFEITVFIMSPIYGAKMSSWGPTRVFNWGILVTGTCCIIFGLLNHIEGRVAFITTCVIVRVVEAMGDAAFDTASFTIIAVEFPNAVATTFAILEICYGLGLIIGPTLGGALYEVGGYSLPFLTMGGLLFVCAVATYFFLPEPGSKQKGKPDGNVAQQNSGTEQPSPVVLGGFHMFKMLKIPVIAMTAYSIVAATAGVGFLSANLDIHLKQFELNKLAVGAIFILNGGVYAITAPAWGWICDHTDHQKLITLVGAIFTIAGFIFIGPVPFFPYDTNLPMACFGLILFGFGLAAILVSAFLQVLKDAIDHGYPDDISTYGLVSGMWTSMAALGYFIGPTVGGFLIDLVGFRWCSLFVIGGQVILIIMLGGYYMASLSKRKIYRLEIRDDPGKEEDVKTHNFGKNISIIANRKIVSDPRRNLATAGTVVNNCPLSVP